MVLKQGTFTYVASAAIGRAKLSRPEMIGLRLYTGGYVYMCLHVCASERESV